jgi:hypothetical protein
MRSRRSIATGCVLLLLAIVTPSVASGQITFAEAGIRHPHPSRPHPSLFAAQWSPITPGQRVMWVIGGTVGPKSLGIGVVSASWDTLFNTPEEWGRTPSGFAKRYVWREIDVAISSTLEAGIGAFWGEDPRFVPSHRHGVKSRIAFAMKTTVLAPRRDGRLALAWGRYAGNVFNNVIENPWLPPSVRGPGDLVWRSASGMAGRLIGNLWEEFWPDIRARLSR